MTTFAGNRNPAVFALNLEGLRRDLFRGRSRRECQYVVASRHVDLMRFEARQRQDQCFEIIQRQNVSRFSAAFTCACE